MVKNLGVKRREKKFDYFLLAIIIIFPIILNSCAMLGIGEKTEEAAVPKEEAPPPPKAEPLPRLPEVSPPPPPPPPVAPPPPPPVKEAQPPVAPPPPLPEPKKEEVKPAPPPTAVYVITLKNANVRAEPDLKSKIIRTLKKGTKVEKIGQTSDWVHIKLPSGKSGWIFHELVKEVE
ncbi:MAG: SH3 domain-containing protein [Thermodesulfobacteriota bacterium]